jgi:hypothetical protein
LVVGLQKKLQVCLKNNYGTIKADIYYSPEYLKSI